MISIKKCVSGIFVFVLSMYLAAPMTCRADESLKNDVQDGAGDVKTHAKKDVRKFKRARRKAKGTDNVLKDAKDKGNDAADGVENSADKAKRRLTE